MFGDCYTRRGTDERNGGGYVEGVEPVAAGATDIEDLAGAGFGIQRRGDGFGAERAGEGGDFGREFRFYGQAGREIGFRAPARPIHR